MKPLSERTSGFLLKRHPGVKCLLKQFSGFPYLMLSQFSVIDVAQADAAYQHPLGESLWPSSASLAVQERSW